MFIGLCTTKFGVHKHKPLPCTPPPYSQRTCSKRSLALSSLEPPYRSTKRSRYRIQMGFTCGKVNMLTPCRKSTRAIRLVGNNEKKAVPRRKPVGGGALMHKTPSVTLGRNQLGTTFCEEENGTDTNAVAWILHPFPDSYTLQRGFQLWTTPFHHALSVLQ